MKWTQEQITELKNFCYKGASNADLAKHFSVPLSEIHAKRSQHNITRAKCVSGVPQNDYKKAFVIKSLMPMLMTANPDIIRASYSKTAVGNENVTVDMKSGAKYHIDVTADSLIAIAYDVINFIKSK